MTTNNKILACQYRKGRPRIDVRICYNCKKNKKCKEYQEYLAEVQTNG